MNDEEIRCIIANNLRLLRRLRDISLHELGKRVGVTGQQIQKYEVGNSAIPLDKLVSIAKALDIRPEVFFTPIDVEDLVNRKIEEE